MQVIRYQIAGYSCPSCYLVRVTFQSWVWFFFPFCSSNWVFVLCCAECRMCRLQHRHRLLKASIFSALIENQFVCLFVFRGRPTGFVKYLFEVQFFHNSQHKYKPGVMCRCYWTKLCLVWMQQWHEMSTHRWKLLRQNCPQGINLSLTALRMTSHSSRGHFESAVVVSSVGRQQLITTKKSDSLHMKAQKQTLEQEVAQHCQCDSLMTLT